MKSAVVTVTGSATQIAAGGVRGNPRVATIRVPAGGTTIYLGDATVSASTGFPLAAGESITIPLVGETLWAVGSGSQPINVLIGS